MVAMSKEGNRWTCVRPAKESAAQCRMPLEESLRERLNVPRWVSERWVSLTLKRDVELIERDVHRRVQGWLPHESQPRGFNAVLERSTMWLRRLLRDKLTE